MLYPKPENTLNPAQRYYVFNKSFKKYESDQSMKFETAHRWVIQKNREKGGTCEVHTEKQYKEFHNFPACTICNSHVWVEDGICADCEGKRPLLDKVEKLEGDLQKAKEHIEHLYYTFKRDWCSGDHLNREKCLVDAKAFLEELGKK